MLKRWIIRGSFLLLLLLCLGGWAWSYRYVDRNEDSGVFLFYRPGRSLFVGFAGGGELAFGWQEQPFLYPERWPMRFGAVPGRPSPPDDYPHFGGLTMYRHYNMWSSTFGRAVEVPFWWLSGLSATGLILGCWLPRKAKAGGAFPVELAAKKEGQ